VDKNILAELTTAMKTRHIKVPALADRLDIPRDRIYKWYQQGTKPKEEDAVKIWNWINGEMMHSVKEDEAPYENLSSYLKTIIKSQEETLRNQEEVLKSQQETIHFLVTGRNRGGNDAVSKRASG